MSFRLSCSYMIHVQLLLIDITANEHNKNPLFSEERVC